MGLFDKLKKNDKQNIENVANNKTEKLPFDIAYSTAPNGHLQIDLHDMNANFKQFYDTTRLIVDRNPLDMEGREVYNCAVSWYGNSDCRVQDPKTGKFDSPRAQIYKGVLVEIDLQLLQSDPNYCNSVMTKLLEQKRVERYLEMGLEENPEYPCGKYVGGINKTENGYEKIFSVAVGQASHNSALMVKRRQENREAIEQQRQKAIEEKRAQIEKLQSEIEGLEH